MYIFVMMSFNVYARRSMKKSQDEKCEDHVSENNVSGIPIEHRQAVQIASVSRRKAKTKGHDDFSCSCPSECENTPR